MTRAARAAAIALAGAVAAIVAVTEAVRLAGPDFSEIARQGFGDRQNSFPWGMTWWRGALYVGRNRAYSCTSQWALSRTLGDVLFPYPPVDSKLECAADPSHTS